VKKLTPATLVGMVFGLLVLLIVGFVVKKVMFADEEVEEVSRGRILPTALGDLEVGTVIKLEHIGRARFERDLTGDELLVEQAIVGRVVKRRIESAVPILASDLYPLGKMPPLAVSSGYRAMTVRIADASALLSGLLHPGEHVDIHWTPEGTANNDPRMRQIGALSMVLFQGIQVLAINKAFVQEPLEASQNTITVEVAEKDASLLRLAEAHGKLTLAFTTDSSGTSMVELKDPNRATLEELLGLPPIPEPVPEPVPPPPYVSTIYRGSGMSRAAFRNGVPIYGGYDYNNTRQPYALVQPVPGQPIPGAFPGQPIPGQPIPGIAPGQPPAGGYFLGPTSRLQTQPGAAPATPANRELPGSVDISSRPTARQPL
jgi:Flp pilus assembly protein CpaB